MNYQIFSSLLSAMVAPHIAISYAGTAHCYQLRWHRTLLSATLAPHIAISYAGTAHGTNIFDSDIDE
jgi:hypothetical protein